MQARFEINYEIGKTWKNLCFFRISNRFYLQKKTDTLHLIHAFTLGNSLPSERDIKVPYINAADQKHFTLPSLWFRSRRQSQYYNSALDPETDQSIILSNHLYFIKPLYQNKMISAVFCDF